MEFRALRGTADLLPEQLTRWERLERTARKLARRSGFEELRTPIIEDAGLFLRSVGETTDIVQKEMFSFEDRGGRAIVLRPEGTAAVVRAYLEHGLQASGSVSKLFYLGPMFRAERPQAGRFRQFHQFGVEAIGSHQPWLDVEVITLCCNILTACGAKNWKLLISSMGCRPDQEISREKLRQRFARLKPDLCKDCQARFDKNVFRLLDCKNPKCHATVVAIMAEFKESSPFSLCESCEKDFHHVREGLRAVGIDFDDKQFFARGLDYYTRTVFELRGVGLGSQDTIAAGGRYDHLVEDFGGPPTGAVGFAAGIERLLMSIEASGTTPATDGARRGVYVAVPKPEFTVEAFRLAHELRGHGIVALIDVDQRSLKAQLREADKLQCQWVAILGEQELNDHSLTVKDLAQGSQRTLARDAFLKELASQKHSCHS